MSGHPEELGLLWDGEEWVAPATPSDTLQRWQEVLAGLSEADIEEILARPDALKSDPQNVLVFFSPEDRGYIARQGSLSAFGETPEAALAELRLVTSQP